MPKFTSTQRKNKNILINNGYYGESVSKEVPLPPFDTITYRAGLMKTSSNYTGTFNFDNGLFQSFYFDGTTYTFEEDEENYGKFKELCVKLAKYFGFSKLSITFGGLEYIKESNTINLTKFVIQDSVDLGKSKYVYTNLSVSESIDLNKLILDGVLALALAAIIIIACFPEALAVGGLGALGGVALRVANAL